VGLYSMCRATPQAFGARCMWGRADLVQVQLQRFEYRVVLLVQLDRGSVACSPYHAIALLEASHPRPMLLCLHLHIKPHDPS
jgi:hypothetical protein